MEFEEPEQQRGPPLPKIMQGIPKEGAAYRPTAGHGKTQRAGSLSALCPDAQREREEQRGCWRSRLERRKPCSALQVETRVDAKRGEWFLVGA